MKIVLVTTLYPLPGEKCPAVTGALKEFVNHWRTSSDVQVVRPVVNSAYLPTHGDPDVSIVKVIRVPGLEYYFVDIKNLALNLPFRPDVVVGHMYKSYLWAWKIATFFQVPFVVGVHYSDILILQLPTLRPRLLKIYSHADGIACRSPAMLAQLMAQFPELEPHAFSAVSGIAEHLIQPVSFFQQKLLRWRAARKIRFATAARLLKRKNIDVTLRALARLPENLKWTFQIIGDGPELHRLQALSSRLNISDQVTFLGWLPREQVFHELRKSDIFILVSAPETFGLAYVEALAAGNIVIGAKNWGVDGFITDGLNGYLCAPKDVDDLLLTMRRIAFDSPEPEIQQLVSNSHELASANTASAVAEAYRRRLQSICRGNS